MLLTQANPQPILTHMIELNKQPGSGFDMIEEFLMTLPKLPEKAPFDYIADDLGITYQRVGVLVRSALDQDIRLQCGPTESGFGVGVSVVSWDRLQRRGNAYWDYTYPDISVTVGTALEGSGGGVDDTEGGEHV